MSVEVIDVTNDSVSDSVQGCWAGQFCACL